MSFTVITFGLIGAAVPPVRIERFNLSMDIFSPVEAALEATPPLAIDNYDVLPPITGL